MILESNGISSLLLKKKKNVSPPPRRLESQVQSCLGARVLLYFYIWINHLVCVIKAHQVWRLGFCNSCQIIQTHHNYSLILTVLTYQITKGGIENYLVSSITPPSWNWMKTFFSLPQWLLPTLNCNFFLLAKKTSLWICSQSEFTYNTW